MEMFFQHQFQSILSRGRPKHGRCDDFSLRHPPMQLSQRAKIFSPFAALKGFEEAIDDKRKIYVEKKELNDEEQAALNAILLRLHEQTPNLRAARDRHLTAAVTYYIPCPDENHEAYGTRGSYETITGVVWKVDPLLRRSILIGDKEIELADIAAIKVQEED